MVSFEAAAGELTVIVSAAVLATVMAADAGAAADTATSSVNGARSRRMAGEATGVRTRTWTGVRRASLRPALQAAAGSGSGGGATAALSSGPGVSTAPAMTAAKPAIRATSAGVP